MVLKLAPPPPDPPGVEGILTEAPRPPPAEETVEISGPAIEDVSPAEPPVLVPPKVPILPAPPFPMVIV